MVTKKDLQCYTKPKKDGGKYTTCVEGQSKAKAKPKKAIKFKVKKEEPKKVEPKKKKAIKFKVKPKPKTVGKTGMTREEFNKLDPAEAFGLLPTLSRKQILDPKKTGVKVAKKKITVRELLNLVNRYVKATKSRQYSKIPPKVQDALVKYSTLDRFDKDYEEREKKFLNESVLEDGVNLAFSKGVTYIPGDAGNKKFETNKMMKNFRSNLEALLGVKLSKYYLGQGIGLAMIMMIHQVLFKINNPVTKKNELMRENYIRNNKEYTEQGRVIVIK
jgi:hypothetical protein